MPEKVNLKIAPEVIDYVKRLSKAHSGEYGLHRQLIDAIEEAKPKPRSAPAGMPAPGSRMALA